MNVESSADRLHVARVLRGEIARARPSLRRRRGFEACALRLRVDTTFRSGRSTSQTIKMMKIHDFHYIPEFLGKCKYLLRFVTLKRGGAFTELSSLNIRGADYAIEKAIYDTKPWTC